MAGPKLLKGVGLILAHNKTNVQKLALIVVCSE
jgi:hypothetical protein